MREGSCEINEGRNESVYTECTVHNIRYFGFEEVNMLIQIC